MTDRTEAKSSQGHTSLADSLDLVKNAVTILGIVIGGVWTVTVFSGTRQRDAALANLSDVQTRLASDKLELEKKTKEQARKATMTPTMKITVHPWEDKRRLMRVELSFTNAGADEIHVPFDNRTFNVRKVLGVDGAGEASLGDPREFTIDGGDTEITGVTMPGGTTSKLEAVQLVESGSYLVRFRVADPLRKDTFYNIFQYVAVGKEQRDERLTVQHALGNRIHQ
jgi:hypothetical protein